MTDRYDALTVVLERDIREDGAEWTINAIKMIKGVMSVEPHVTDLASMVAETRVRREWRDKLMALVYPDD